MNICFVPALCCTVRVCACANNNTIITAPCTVQIGQLAYAGLREADELITAEGEARSTKRGVWQYITEADAEASKQHGADGDDEDYGIGLRPIGSGSVSNAAAGLGGMSLGGADAAAAGDGGADASMPALPAPGGAAAASSSSSSASAIPCVLADITDGSRFTIQAEADRCVCVF